MDNFIIDFKDKDLFGNDAGEDETPEILNSYFIDIPEFEDFYNPLNSLCVVSARKGMGKSALLYRLAYRLNSTQNTDNSIIIITTGNALLGLGDFDDKSEVYLENYWKQIICKRINIEIGKKIGFAFTHDEMAMVEASELEGLKNKNIIGALVSRIKGKIPLLDLELKSSIPENLVSLLNNYQENHKNSTVWLLIDDIDAKYIDNQEYQTRVGAFFSAIRGLVREVENIKVRATIRTDVWKNLRHLEDLDKWEQYIIEINWSKKNLRNILAKRILAYVNRKYNNSGQWDITKDYDKIFELVFTKDMKWGSQYVNPFDPIKTLSNGRPRWMGQLCRMSGLQASKIGTNRISIKEISFILDKFGQFRKNDLIKEHHHQFSDLSTLIDSFRSGSREYTFSELNQLFELKYVYQKKQENIPEINGKKYHSPTQFGSFLYQIGFISQSKGDNINFIHYQDAPDLYNSFENETNNIIWAIHPCYRKYLNIN